MDMKYFLKWQQKRPRMKRHFLTGIAILLPLAVTIWIVSFVVDLLTDPFLDMTKNILITIGISGSPFVSFISKILILLFLVTFILGIGAVTRYFFFRYLIRLGDMVLHKIPVISSVYKTSQELIQTIFTSDNKAFKQVVLVPFPHKDARTIGLLSRDDLSGDTVPVFIPTTPNPTSGYLVFFNTKDVVLIDMPVETAMRYVISCGVLIDQKSAQSVFTPMIEKR